MLKKIKNNSAIRFILLLGIVSLFADITVEGAKSITGAFLADLGASAAIVGIVSGFGEFAGYALRLISGYFIDKTARYWLFTLIGYGLNLLAIPLLAITGSWKIAAALLIIERIGKAVRTPARDAMLSHATQEIGRGFGFGLHQTLDQLGSMLGPIIITIVLFFKGTYQQGFAVLFLPALAAIIALVIASNLFPSPQNLEIDKPKFSNDKKSEFWIFLLASMSLAAGFADFPLIAFHFAKINLFSPTYIPFSYAIGLGISSASVLFFGKLYDCHGNKILIFATILASLFTPLVFLGKTNLAFLGMILWGVGTGAQSSLLKAIIGDIIPKEKRGSAYGIFNAGFGFACFIGSALLGVLYDVSLGWMIACSMVLQLLSVPLFIVARKQRG